MLYRKERSGVPSLNTEGLASILDERNRGSELEENVYNLGQCGKLSEQVLSTFSSPYFGKQLFINTDTGHLLL